MVFQTNLNLSLDSPDGYITQLDKFGNIQQVPINFGEAIVENEPNPLADFMSTDILAKPFNFVSGNVSKSRFNPFRKKSGLLNVLARQATKNRIVAKNGFLNTQGSADGKKHKFFKVSISSTFYAQHFLNKNLFKAKL